MRERASQCARGSNRRTAFDRAGGPLGDDRIGASPYRKLRAAHSRIMHGNPRRRVISPFDRDRFDGPVCAARDPVGHRIGQRPQGCLNARQFPFEDAFGSPRGTVALSIRDCAAQEQRLVPCSEGAVVARLDLLLRDGLGGKRSSGEQRCGGDGMSDHARLVPCRRSHAKQKGRTVSRPAPHVFIRERLRRLRTRCLHSSPGPNPGPWRLRRGRPAR